MTKHDPTMPSGRKTDSLTVSTNPKNVAEKLTIKKSRRQTVPTSSEAAGAKVVVTFPERHVKFFSVQEEEFERFESASAVSQTWSAFGGGCFGFGLGLLKDWFLISDLSETKKTLLLVFSVALIILALAIFFFRRDKVKEVGKLASTIRDRHGCRE
jgi:flagellar biosynthesis/type III secretory pathway M-ring protein FliF/YscJ